MARRGRTYQPIEQRPVILALECPRFEGSSSNRQPSRPRARAPRYQFTSLATQFCPCIVTVHAGEDAGEKIRVFFEEQKDTILSSCKGLLVEGRIIGVSGEISNPKINIAGSTIIFEGTYSIATLTGCYIICNNGLVQLDFLNLSFQPDDRVVGGSVAGPLIASCSMQVTLGCAKLDHRQE